jgi:ribonuclease Z
LKIITLGSSGGAPTKRRNCSSFVLAEESYGIMFDCAEGTQRQLLFAGYKMSRIKYVLISHLHFDHISGLVPMLSTKSMFKINNPVTIIGPERIKEFIDLNLNVAGTKFSFPYEVIGVSDGAAYEFDDFTVSSHLLNHRIESYGYRLKFRDMPGNIIKEKLSSFGLEEGPVCGRLKSGETVVLEDGRKISLSDVAGEGRKGKIISLMGDTYLCKGLYACMDNADFAVIESTFLEDQTERAVERTHLTAKSAGNVAERSKVKELMLYHFSASYPVIDDFRKECAEKFSGKIHLAEDLKEIII